MTELLICVLGNFILQVRPMEKGITRFIIGSPSAMIITCSLILPLSWQFAVLRIANSVKSLQLPAGMNWVKCKEKLWAAMTLPRHGRPNYIHEDIIPKPGLLIMLLQAEYRENLGREYKVVKLKQ